MVSPLRVARFAAVAATILLVSSTALAKTITIQITFQYTGPDGANHPCRWCWCELRDYDPIRDDIIKEGYTDASGRVSFSYDSKTDDGLMGGRIDPYVRCYTRLCIPANGENYCIGYVVGKRRIAITQLQLAYYETNTERWDDNNSNRTVTRTLSGETGKAFFIMDCLATANTPPPGRATGGGYRPPMSLGSGLCSSPAMVVYPSLLGTKFSPLTNEVLIDTDHDQNADSITHEYGHHEMYQHYGGVFGSYDRTQSNHGFNSSSPSHWYSTADADWTAFCEGWADYSAAATKRIPSYHGFDTETRDLNTASSRCEGTVCRVLWDITDDRDSKVMQAGSPVDRPERAGQRLDDDPFGFAATPFYRSLPGMYDLKNIIRDKRPKTIGQLRAHWQNQYGANSITSRAFDAVMWENGLHDNITNHTPSCTLTVGGSNIQKTVNGVQRDCYVGDLTLTANVTDADALDSQLHHVTFYWSHVSPGTGQLYTADVWTPIGVDLDGSNGFSCPWPVSAQPQNKTIPVCVIAVASDFFSETTYSLNPASLTPAQKGPMYFAQAADATAFRTSKASSSSGWYWLKQTGAYAEWEFSASDIQSWASGSTRLRFDGLITNGAGGGAGYTSNLSIFIQSTRGAFLTVPVPTVNPYGAPNPNLRTGAGYTVYGNSGALHSAFMNVARSGGTVKAKLTWPDGVDNSYHVAVKKESLKLIHD